MNSTHDKEQNWATQEAYLWLANDELAYQTIMASRPDERKIVAIDIVARWQYEGLMGNFSRKDFDAVDWDSLADDFKEEE